MAEESRIVDVTAEGIVAVVEEMTALPWPEDDEVLEWEIDGLEGQTTRMTHVLPLAQGVDEGAIAVLATRLVWLADNRWGERHTFDASADPASYDRGSAPASRVRSLGANAAVWWRCHDHAVLLIDSFAAQPQARRLVVLVLAQERMETPGVEGTALASPLDVEFLSGDKDRIISAMWKVWGTRDPALLGPLVTALPAVRKATSTVELGGLLVTNRSNLERAFQRIEVFATGVCLCTAYRSHRLAQEVEAGHVRIVGTVPNERQWVPDAICECTACGRRYQVEEGEGHGPWWRWRALP